MNEDNAVTESDEQLTDRMLDDPINAPEQIEASKLGLDSLRSTVDDPGRADNLEVAVTQLGYFKVVVEDLQAARDNEPPLTTGPEDEEFRAALMQLDSDVSAKFAVDCVQVFFDEVGLPENELDPTLNLLTSMLKRPRADVTAHELMTNIHLGDALDAKLNFSKLLPIFLKVITIILKVITVVRFVAIFLISGKLTDKTNLSDSVLDLSNFARDNVSPDAVALIAALVRGVVQQASRVEASELEGKG